MPKKKQYRETDDMYVLEEKMLHENDLREV